MYTVTRSRHQSKTKYLIGVCVTSPYIWIKRHFSDFDATQVALNTFEMTAQSGDHRLNFILEFKKQDTDIKFNDITLTMSTKSLL